MGTLAKKRQMRRAQGIGALRSTDRGRQADGVRRARMQAARTANPTSPLGREWFRSPIFPFSNPLFPHRGRVYPSPYPLPWTWREGSASGQGSLFGPRWLQEGLREPKIASKIDQDSPTWLKIAHNMPPTGSNTAPRRLQVVKEPPEEAPEKPKSFKKHMKINVFGHLAFSLLMGF